MSGIGGYAEGQQVIRQGQTVSRPVRSGVQDWRDYLDLVCPRWRYDLAPKSTPFFAQGELPDISQATINAQPDGVLRVKLAEFKSNRNQFICLQYAGIRSYVRAVGQVAGTPSVEVAPLEFGNGAAWSIRWAKGDASPRASSVLRDLEGAIVGEARTGFTDFRFYSTVSGWIPLIFEGEGSVEIAIELTNLGTFATNSICRFFAQMGGYSAPIPNIAEIVSTKGIPDLYNPQGLPFMPFDPQDRPHQQPPSQPPPAPPPPPQQPPSLPPYGGYPQPQQMPPFYAQPQQMPPFYAQPPTFTQIQQPQGYAMVYPQR